MLTINNTTNESAERFAALVMADEALAETLSRVEEPEAFVDLALQCAGKRGIALDAGAVRATVRSDPLGFAPFDSPPLRGSAWPPRRWLPIQVAMAEGRICVDWAYFGERSVTEPFFADSIRLALRLPFARMLRYRMTLGDFLNHADEAQSLPPAGFIFHMSRCGSTLAAQMLAASPRNVVIAEAAPIDAMVQLGHGRPDLPADAQARLLAAMIAAFGRRRGSGADRYVVKLDSWHTLALPLFRRAFPSVPWAFLYRDPVEVLVSQMRQRGAQMVPEFVPPSLYGIDSAEGLSGAEYCARVLERVCRAVADNVGLGGGLLVNYRELPGAVWTKILPHFGIVCGESERETMRAVALHDAKAPSFAFADDSEAKQREATAQLRTTAERHLGDVYRELEVLRAGSLPR